MRQDQQKLPPRDESQEFMERPINEVRAPYDYRSLIEAYVLSSKEDFVHQDFSDYYSGLVAVLEQELGVKLSVRPGMMLFHSTIYSMLRIGTPWDGFLEAGLLHRRLEEAGALGEEVYRASARVGRASRECLAAHREMLYALFKIEFGEVTKVLTSDDLRNAGFDDARQPSIHDSKYHDLWCGSPSFRRERDADRRRLSTP